MSTPDTHAADSSSPPPPRSKLPYEKILMARVFICWLGLFALGVAVPSQPFRDVLVSIIAEIKVASGFTGSPLSPAPVPSPPGPAPLGLAAGSAGPMTVRSASFDAPLPVSSSLAPTQARAEAPLANPSTRWAWPVCIAALIPLLLAFFVTFTPTNLLLLCCCASALGALVVRQLPAAFGRSAEANPLVAVPTVIAMLHGLIVFAGAVAGLIVVQGEFKWDQTRGDLYLRLAATVTIISIAAGTNPHFVRDLAQAFMPFRGGQNVPPARASAP